MIQDNFQNKQNGLSALKNTKDMLLLQLKSVIQSANELLEKEYGNEVDILKRQREQARNLIESDRLLAEKLLSLQNHIYVRDRLIKVQSDAAIIIDKAIETADKYVSKRRLEVDRFQNQIASFVESHIVELYSKAINFLNLSVEEPVHYKLEVNSNELRNLYEGLLKTLKKMNADFHEQLDSAYMEYVIEQKQIETELKEESFIKSPKEELNKLLQLVQLNATIVYEYMINKANIASEIVKEQTIESHILKIAHLDNAYTTFVNFLAFSSIIFQNTLANAILIQSYKPRN